MVSDQDVDENTPFLLAVESESAECMEHLLKCGSDVNQCSSNKTFPIHNACTAGNLDIVKLLVKVRNKIHLVIKFKKRGFNILKIK